MIQFNYSGNPLPSIQQQQDDKTSFLQKLGPLKEEFDAKDGTVTFDYSYPVSDANRIKYSLGNGYYDDLPDFVRRFGIYLRGHESSSR